MNFFLIYLKLLRVETRLLRQRAHLCTLAPVTLARKVLLSYTDPVGFLKKPFQHSVSYDKSHAGSMVVISCV